MPCRVFVDELEPQGSLIKDVFRGSKEEEAQDDVSGVVGKALLVESGVVGVIDG